MKVLTVKQPWADLIMAGVKPVENRSWPVPSTLPQWRRCQTPCCRARYRKDDPLACLGPSEPDGPFPFTLGIHAAKTPDPRSREILEAEYGADAYMTATVLPGDSPDRYGVLMGTVQVTGCHHADECKGKWGINIHGHGRHRRPAGVDVRKWGCEHVPDGSYCSRWAEPDCWHWTLSDPEPLDVPVPMPGRQGLWTLTEATT